jgi:hypothetical protein
VEITASMFEAGSLFDFNSGQSWAPFLNAHSEYVYERGDLVVADSDETEGRRVSGNRFGSECLQARSSYAKAK